ncbi:hypothetical protein E2C01_070750 [Portunus trituberculatus]|uniref:Uncharacterized protein n=1 Tax=Portunus trituberculatus TaxID=210409 RepID=A0A5B7HV06_PORTR|nr:hypothetical protein [Portunus trituberculatus]
MNKGYELKICLSSSFIPLRATLQRQIPHVVKFSSPNFNATCSYCCGLELTQDSDTASQAGTTNHEHEDDRMKFLGSYKCY